MPPTPEQTTATTAVGTAFGGAAPTGLTPQQQAAFANVQKQFAPPTDTTKTPVTSPGTTDTTKTTTPTPALPITSGNTPPPDTTNQDALKSAQDARQVVSDQLFSLGTQVSKTISDIQNGITPLSSGEQAQLDGLKSQFDGLIRTQTTANQNQLDTEKFFEARIGGQYTPLARAQRINDVVTKGQQAVADLQIKEASAVADLTQNIKNNDIAAVKDSWNIYQDAATQRQTALKDMVNDTQAAIKSAQDAQTTANNYALDVAKFNQTKDQNAFDNALKIEQQKFDEQNKNDQLALDQFKAGMGAGGGSGGITTPSASLGPDGNPDPATQKAVLDNITSTYGPMTATAIKSLADYSMNPADWSTRTGGKGMTREQAVTLAKMLDPTYSDTNYSIRAAYLKSISSTQTGTVGSAINAANKSINHLTAFVNSMSTIPNGPIGFVNAFDNALTLNQGVKQNVAAAQTEGLGVAEELAKFFKGSGTVDVASIEAWKSQLNTGASPAAVKGLTQGAITLLAGQLETLTEQYSSTMGKQPETDFLNASARANLSNLKNQGYVVDIPGINYTDKAAYLKADPDAQTNMNAAVTALTNAGLPLTPENILQAAQSL